MCPGGSLTTQHSNAVSSHSVSRDWRRRSADIGGLHLATTTEGQGQGWMGGDLGVSDSDTNFAELIADMYIHTNSSVNDNSLSGPPPQLVSSVRSRLIYSLDRWNFEPHKLPDEEQLECTLILFEALFRVEGMQEAVPVSTRQISAFIHHLSRIYRMENTYHNFEHALDVLQATHSYLKSAGMVPSPKILFEPNRTWKPTKTFDSGHIVSCLGLRELFILYVAAIGHDVGHPGFTNGFMKNAKAPLSLLFNNTSALENLHYILLISVMRSNGLCAILDDMINSHHLKKLLQYTVLATDMSVHDDFMQRMKRMLDGELGPVCQRQIIVCQAILKNADISNPTRPFLVSKHWSNALMQEWTAQAALETELQLNPTINSSNDPISEANSQIFFIENFAKPLLELTEKVIPELSMYSTQCKLNLKDWRKQKILLIKQQAPSSPPLLPPPPPPLATLPTISTSLIPPPISPSQVLAYTTAFPLSLPPTRNLPESLYAASSSGRSDNESVPDSPTETESVSSATFSSISEGSNTLSVIAGSVAGSTTSISVQPPLHKAIRSAIRVGTQRQVKEAKDARVRSSGARNSWCMETTATWTKAGGTLGPPFLPFGDRKLDGATPTKGPVSPPSPGVAPPPLQPLAGQFMIPRPLNVPVLP